MQGDGGEECRAAILPDHAVKKRLWLPADQDVPDVKNNGLNGHAVCPQSWDTLTCFNGAQSNYARLTDRSSRSKASRKRDLSAFENALPPP